MTEPLMARRLRLSGVMKRLRQKAVGERNSVGDLWGNWICREAADEIEQLMADLDAHARLQAENEALRRERDEAKRLRRLAEESREVFGEQLSIMRAEREAADAKAARLEEALKQAEVWLSHMGYNIYGVLVKDDMPDHEPVLRAARAALGGDHG